jgi:hypothetical protein
MIIGVELDTQLEKKFLKTQFNMEKDCFRSPFSQVYYP